MGRGRSRRAQRDATRDVVYGNANKLLVLMLYCGTLTVAPPLWFVASERRGTTFETKEISHGRKSERDVHLLGEPTNRRDLVVE
jgi:hypothetical protein